MDDEKIPLYSGNFQVRKQRKITQNTLLLPKSTKNFFSPNASTSHDLDPSPTYGKNLSKIGDPLFYHFLQILHGFLEDTLLTVTHGKINNATPDKVIARINADTDT